MIESEAGTMARWGVRVGDQLDVRGLDGADPVIDVRDPGAGHGATPASPAPASPADLTGDGDGTHG